MSNYLLYIVLGIAPSIIWLLFYLKKDKKPEPKSKILQVFVGGIAAAILAAITETIILKKLLGLEILNRAVKIVLIFLVIAFIEEILKYLAVRLLVFKDSELDEPIDIVIYMIIAALGFAALENVFLFFSEQLQIFETVLVAALRFVGATFLHALSSGILGFFIALWFSKNKKNVILLFAGISFSVVLHALYNFFIIKTSSFWRFALPGILLILSAAFLGFCFKKLKNMKSICQT